MVTVIGPMLLLGSLVWLFVNAVRMPFKGQRPKARKHIKWSSLALVLAFVLVGFGPRNPVSTDTSQTVANTDAKADVATSAVPTPQPEQVAAADIVEAKPDETYLNEVKLTLELVKELKASDFTKDAKRIVLGFALFSEWAKTADKAPENMTDKETALRKQLISALSSKQKQMFPALRDAYGPAMRKALWEADGKARTTGGGYRTVEFISGAFAANRNIKSFHNDLRETLMQMRFTRAQYKWLDANVEYTYYTMEPPSDGVVGVWTRGSFKEVK